MRNIWRAGLVGLVFIVSMVVGYGVHWKLSRVKLPEGQRYFSPVPTQSQQQFLNIWQYLNAEILGRGVTKTLVDSDGCSQWGVEAKGWLAYDLTQDEILCGNKIDEARPIASITKLMTAVVGMEFAGGVDQRIRIGPEAAAVGEASMHLTKGEVLTVKELMYGMLLRSGNDAAEALAQGVGQRRSMFIQLMNQKAKELGMKQTEFVNPTGLDEDNGRANLSSPLDLAVLVKYIIKEHKEIVNICGTSEIRLPATNEHKFYYLVSQLGLEQTYPGMKGLKPGNSDYAGLTLVGLAEDGGREVVAVLLDSPSPREDVRKLFDRAFGQNYYY